MPQCPPPPSQDLFRGESPQPSHSKLLALTPLPPTPTNLEKCDPLFGLIKHLKVVKWAIHFEFTQFAYHYNKIIMVQLIWHSSCRSTEAA